MKNLLMLLVLLLNFAVCKSTFTMSDNDQLIDLTGRISPEDDDFKSCENLDDPDAGGEVNVCPYENLLLHIKTLHTFTFFIALQCDLNSAVIRQQDNFIYAFGQPFLHSLLKEIDLLDGDLYELSNQPIASAPRSINKAYCILKKIASTCNITINESEYVRELSERCEAQNGHMTQEETWDFFNRVKSCLFTCLAHAKNYPNSFAQEAATLRRERICFETIIPTQVEREEFLYFEVEEFKSMFDLIKQAAGIFNSDALFQASLLSYANHYRAASKILYQKGCKLQPGIDAMLQRCAVISLEQQCLNVESDI